MRGRALQSVIFAGLCACGRIGFSGTAGGDGGGGSDAGGIGGDPDAMAGDPSALACNVAFQLMDITTPKYWFGAGPYGVVVATKADDADTMTVSRFSQQGSVLNGAGSVELEIDRGLFQPFVTAVDGGWIVGATDNLNDTHLVALSGGLTTRAERDTPYAVWNMATKGDHAMAAVSIDTDLAAVELSPLGADLFPVNVVDSAGDWDEPFLAASGTGMLVSMSLDDQSNVCLSLNTVANVAGYYQMTWGTATPPCMQLTMARNDSAGQTMGIMQLQTGAVQFAEYLQAGPMTGTTFATGDDPYIVQSGDHYVVTYVDSSTQLQAIAFSTRGLILGATMPVGARFDDGRLDSMANDVPVMIWLDNGALFAERLCL